MEHNNELVFSIVVEYLSFSIVTDPDTYFNCLMCSKVMQEKILEWKPITTIFSQLPIEKRIINSIGDWKLDHTPKVTKNIKSYLECVRTYCYLFNLSRIKSFKILGFVTDAPIEILNKTNILVFPVQTQQILNITHYETCKYVQITETYTSKLSQNSEIILGRHPIFAKINLDIIHTSSHEWYIETNKYFICFVTGLPVLNSKS